MSCIHCVDLPGPSVHPRPEQPAQHCVYIIQSGAKMGWWGVVGREGKVHSYSGAVMSQKLFMHREQVKTHLPTWEGSDAWAST